nr:hypothetical protein [uncultured Shinella sp.]
MTDALKDWFGLAALIIAVATSAWNIISSGAKKTASELAEFRKQDAEEKKALMEAVAALGTRTQAIEIGMEHLPDAKAVYELRLALEQLSGKLGRMEENQIGMSRTVLQVQDFLMKGAA